ncbi:prepilin-type N-terminal cleavage/methylation domain-containing protein [Halomonas sp. LR5S13]|uniref:PilW family protein n=1 Tax=Halomonas rhizosphaerae TaxID=3043296 RepID=UPI0024A9D493|nr:prepilin-type N-terminal cleavage/methylation domain-containing protein [Halomonas rhizosphaerae]MDI5922438.1 prepilin-type N-terminal cleavage/methylation domain-containing protein [Halomonas rhizosphaerae]
MFEPILIGRKEAGGFSLVELMIALVIGLIIVLGAGQLLLMGVQSFREMESLAKRQETIRYMADVLSEDIRSAFNRVSQNEVSVDPSEESVRVEDDGKVLILEYFEVIDDVGFGREGIPYCVNGDELRWLRYTFSQGELSVATVCESDEGAAVDDHDVANLDSATSETIISGLSDLTFSDAGDTEPSTFNVQVSFPAIGDESVEKTFSFFVVNRIKAMAKIN